MTLQETLNSKDKDELVEELVGVISRVDSQEKVKNGTRQDIYLTDNSGEFRCQVWGHDDYTQHLGKKVKFTLTEGIGQKAGTMFGVKVHEFNNNKHFQVTQKAKVEFEQLTPEDKKVLATVSQKPEPHEVMRTVHYFLDGLSDVLKELNVELSSETVSVVFGNVSNAISNNRLAPVPEDWKNYKFKDVESEVETEVE